jgi:hypothetical protein
MRVLPCVAGDTAAALVVTIDVVDIDRQGPHCQQQLERKKKRGEIIISSLIL